MTQRDAAPLCLPETDHLDAGWELGSHLMLCEPLRRSDGLDKLKSKNTRNKKATTKSKSKIKRIQKAKNSKLEAKNKTIKPENKNNNN